MVDNPCDLCKRRVHSACSLKKLVKGVYYCCCGHRLYEDDAKRSDAKPVGALSPEETARIRRALHSAKAASKAGKQISG